MSRSYSAEIEIASLATAKTVLLLELPATCVVKLDGAYITNADNDSNEQHQAGLFRVATKGSPVGTSVTPNKKDEGDPASGLTVLGNLTTEPTAYDAAAIGRQGWSNLSGYVYEPVLGSEVYVGPSQLIGLKLIDAPSAGFKAVAVIEFTEIGGS